MSKKMDSEPVVEPESRDGEEQLWYCIQFDEDSPPVMVAIDDPSVLNNETEKEALIDDAWRFHCRGMWARENSNPRFLRDLAGDFRNSIPVPNMIARTVVSELLEIYAERLDREVKEKGEAAVDETAPHLKIEWRGPQETTIIFDPPDGWD